MFFSQKKELAFFNFYSDQNGISERFCREGIGWEAHIHKTKSFIIKNIPEGLSKKVIVLGSGWLIDVPILELSKSFNDVYLCDIIHPREVKQKMKRFSNVHFIELDLTGGMIYWLYSYLKKNKNVKEIPWNEFKLSSIDFTDFDYVVSVNILNQLDILLADTLINYCGYEKSKLIEFRKMVQGFHISCLPHNKSCLITDYEELVCNEKLEVLEKKVLLYQEIKEKNIEYWQWDFDKSKTYNSNSITLMNVLATLI